MEKIICPYRVAVVDEVNECISRWIMGRSGTMLLTVEKAPGDIKEKNNAKFRI